MAYTKDPAKMRGPYRTKPFDEEAFWAKMDRSGGSDSCWEWKAWSSRIKRGNTIDVRPYVTFNKEYVLAYRVAWFLTIGEWPPFTICLCHKCDNGNCCNPKHMFLGTDADNIRDMWNKGRQQRYTGFATGDKHHMAMLTNQKAREIMDEWRSGRWKTRKALAAHYGVPKDTVNNIVKGQTYKEAMV